MYRHTAKPGDSRSHPHSNLLDINALEEMAHFFAAWSRSSLGLECVATLRIWEAMLLAEIERFIAKSCQILEFHFFIS
jgi:hypothetical protein